MIDSKPFAMSFKTGISDMEIRLATEADLSAHGALGRHGAQRAAMSNLTRRHNITPIRGLP